MTIDSAQASHWLSTLFAPWVRELNLQVASVDESSATLRLPFDAKLCRTGGTVCGQALMAAADTAMVIAIAAQLGEFKPMTTVSLNIDLMRPVAGGDVQVIARVRKPGKTITFGEIEMVGADGKLVARATTTYAML